MKTSNSTYIIVLIALFASIVFIVSIFLSEILSEVLTISTAIFSVIVIIIQLQKDHKIKKAEFVYSLNNTFNDNPDIKNIYNKLKENRDKEYVFTQKETREMVDYITYFDILGYLLDQKLVAIDFIDDLFAYRFFIFVNNKYVQKYQLEYTFIQGPIIRLYVKWYNYRITNDMEELYNDESFTEYRDFFIKNDDGTITFNEERANIKYYTQE